MAGGGSIGDLYLALRGDGARLAKDAQVEGQKAGDAGAKSFSKSFGGQVKKGFKQGIGIGAGLGVASAVASGISAVGDALGGAIEKAIAFERAMANVNSIAKYTDEELADASRAVLELSSEFGQSAETMAQGLYDITSSGFQGAEALEVLRSATIAATAGLSTTAQASSGITAVLNAYGMEAGEAAKVSDILFETVNRGVIDFATLSENIGKTTALSAPLGVSLEEVAAAAALLTRNGVGAEDAFTQINAVMNSMLKPSKEAADLADDLGLRWDAQALASRGLVGQMQDLIGATDGSSEKMATLLGDSRAIRGAFVLAKDAGADFTAELGFMESASGAASEAFAIQSNTVDFKVKQIQTSMDNFSTDMGTKFILGLGAWMEGMDSILSTTSDAIDVITFWDETMTVAQEKAQRMAEESAAAIRKHMAGAAKDDMIIAGAAATEMGEEFGEAADKVLEDYTTMIDQLVGETERLIGEVYDPAIQKAKLLATATELADLDRVISAKGVTQAYKDQAILDADTDKERIAARALVTDEEIADAKRRRTEVAKEYDLLRLEMLTSGTLTAEETDQWLADLQEDFDESTGSARSDIAALIAKIKELRAASAKGIKVNVSTGFVVPDGYAEGGHTTARKTILVGETGPELFTPDWGGTVIPAQQTAAILGGSSGGSAGSKTINVNLLDRMGAQSPRDISDGLRMLGERGYL